MRVTHVITRLILGGAQENTVYSVLGLQRKPGLKVQLISGPTTGPEGSLEPLLAGVSDALMVLPELVRPVRPRSDWTAYRKLIALFRQDRPEVVHTHSGKAGVLGRLAAAKAGVPLIVHTIHGPSFGKFQGPIANALFTFAEKRAGRLTDHFVVVADAMRNQYLGAGIGHASQFTKILSGFDLEPFLSARNDPHLRAKLGIAPDDFVVGKIARLVELKGHDDLFAVAHDLAARFPRLKFLLVGDGYWRRRFEELANSRGLAGRFIFTGLVSPSEIPRLVGVMNLLVHLSSREGLARALPQAMAAARPIVVYDCDGAREVCFDGRTGYLVAPGDLAGLRDRIAHLAVEPALRERMGQAGREFVRQRFSTQTMVDSLHDLYLKLGAAKGLRLPEEQK